MTRTDDLIDELAGGLTPVRPMRPPLQRALLMLAALGIAGLLLIHFLADPRIMEGRLHADGTMLAVELAATLATGVAALIAAFELSVPGARRAWLAAPLPFLALWLLLGGVGCMRALALGHAASEPGMDCLYFILGSSVIIGPAVVWALSRARPLDPLPVALAGGLGIAAFSAFLLQFFHPFTVTFVDLAIHLLAVTIVVGALALLKRPMLRPA